jgi:hypothetical protein
VLTPEEAGFERMPLKALEGGDPADNAARLRALLDGGGSQAEQQAVALNAGALLWTAGLAPSFGRNRQALDAAALGRGRTDARCLRRGDQWLTCWPRSSRTSGGSGGAAAWVRRQRHRADHPQPARGAEPAGRPLHHGGEARFAFGASLAALGGDGDRAYAGVADGVSVPDRRALLRRLVRGAGDGPRALRRAGAGQGFRGRARQVAEARRHGADAVLCMLSVLGRRRGARR